MNKNLFSPKGYIFRKWYFINILIIILIVRLFEFITISIFSSLITLQAIIIISLFFEDLLMLINDKKRIRSLIENEQISWLFAIILCFLDVSMRLLALFNIASNLSTLFLILLLIFHSILIFKRGILYKNKDDLIKNNGEYDGLINVLICKFNKNK